MSKTFIKFIYILEVHRKQNINFLINKRESTGLKYLMTQKLLLDTEMI